MSRSYEYDANVLVVLAIAAVAVLVCVVLVSLGRGGELTEFPPDIPPLELPDAGQLSAVDFMALQLPVNLVGYNTQLVDETLRRAANAISARDTRIAVLEQRVSELLASRLQARQEVHAGPGESVRTQHEPRPPEASLVLSESEAVTLGRGREPYGHGADRWSAVPYGQESEQAEPSATEHRPEAERPATDHEPKHEAKDQPPATEHEAKDQLLVGEDGHKHRAEDQRPATGHEPRHGAEGERRAGDYGAEGERVASEREAQGERSGAEQAVDAASVGEHDAKHGADSPSPRPQSASRWDTESVDQEKEAGPKTEAMDAVEERVSAKERR